MSVSGAGVALPGDAKGLGARLVSGLTRRLARELVLDREGERAVRLQWAGVDARCGRLGSVDREPKPGGGGWGAGTGPDGRAGDEGGRGAGDARARRFGAVGAPARRS